MLQLNQSGARVTGVAFSPDFPDSRNNLEGTVSGSTFTFVLIYPIALPPECSQLDSRGTAQVVGNTMNGTVTSSIMCLGFGQSFTSSFSATRQ